MFPAGHQHRNVDCESGGLFLGEMMYTRFQARTVYNVLAVVAALAAVGCERSHEATAPKLTSAKAVLVTGASSGIGRKITERLAAHGYLVYAGARKESDLRELAGLRNVQPIRLDVTKPEDIDAAVATVKQAGHGLYGLVNNAGVVATSPVLNTKMAEFDTVMDVNVYGPWRVTQAFAPLIIESKGRITNISSINGINAPPRLGAYSMSKHAVEALSDALSEEVGPQGVAVSVVEPGSYRSEIGANQVRRSGKGRDVAKFMAQAKDPEEVAAAVEESLFEANPKRRYMVVPDAHQAEVAIKAQLEHLVQMNEDQPYEYDRDALVKMLDEQLSASQKRDLSASR
jgi:NAD(P)-dependent dehydrogenase (short-subunit alcohol dehydrogenase family)